MKALYGSKLYVVTEMTGDAVQLEPVDDEGPTIEVSFGDPALIVDPTDSDLEWEGLL